MIGDNGWPNLGEKRSIIFYVLTPAEVAGIKRRERWKSQLKAQIDTEYPELTGRQRAKMLEDATFRKCPPAGV